MKKGEQTKANGLMEVLQTINSKGDQDELQNLYQEGTATSSYSNEEEGAEKEDSQQ